MASKLVKQGKTYCVSVFSAPELVTCHPSTIIIDVEDECVI